MGEKLITIAVLCGAGTTEAWTPYMPITLKEIAVGAVACAKADAAVIHIHVRDRNGINSMDTKRLYQVVNLIRKECGKAGVDPVLNLTTSGSKWPEDIRRACPSILKPEMYSYDPGTMNWTNSYVFTNTPTLLEQLSYEVRELDIKPECEIFDGGMTGNVDYYVKKGVLEESIHYQFVLGVAGGMRGNTDPLAFLLLRIWPGSTWSIIGIGRNRLPCIPLGLAEGCHGLRAGLEDNILMEKGVLATNASLAERTMRVGELAGRSTAIPGEVRDILGLIKHI